MPASMISSGLNPKRTFGLLQVYFVVFFPAAEAKSLRTLHAQYGLSV